MAVGSGDFHVVADYYAVQSRNWARCVKAFGRLHQPVMMEREFIQCATVRPLVEITHENRGHLARAAINRRQQCADLLAPPQPR